MTRTYLDAMAFTQGQYDQALAAWHAARHTSGERGAEVALQEAEIRCSQALAAWFE